MFELFLEFLFDALLLFLEFLLIHRLFFFNKFLSLPELLIETFLLSFHEWFDIINLCFESKVFLHILWPNNKKILCFFGYALTCDTSVLIGMLLSSGVILGKGYYGNGEIDNFYVSFLSSEECVMRCLFVPSANLMLCVVIGFEYCGTYMLLTTGIWS